MRKGLPSKRCWTSTNAQSTSPSIFADMERRRTGCSLCPAVSYGGERGELKSRLRSAISPWLDRREPIDVIRDRLEERGLALSRQLEPVS